MYIHKLYIYICKYAPREFTKGGFSKGGFSNSCVSLVQLQYIRFRL